MRNNFYKIFSVDFRAGFDAIVLQCLKSFPYIWVSLDKVLIISICLMTVGVTQLIVGKCRLLTMLCRLIDLTMLVLCFQFVSSCTNLLCLKHADHHYPWLFRMSVPVLSHCISSLLMMLFLAIQAVSDGLASLCFKSADYICPWLFQLVCGYCVLLHFRHSDFICPQLSSL